ncbi:MAG: RNA polymerase sigma factor [Gaiellaceae bacterium]
MADGVLGDLRQQYDQIYRYVRRRTPCDADAEDVTQEVFADMAKAIDRFRAGSPPLIAWLYTVAQRRLADAARAKMRRPDIALGSALEIASTPPSEYGPGVGQAIDRGLRRLGRLQQQVVVMKLIEGKSFAEIAEATRSNEGTCRMRFLRGLEQLRAFLETEGIAP